MKQWLLICLLLLLSMRSQAQVYGNEWIEYNQKYLSFKIIPTSLTGNFINSPDKELTRIYVIDYATLTAALSGIGESTSAISSDYFQIFGKEKEIPLHIEDGGNNLIDNPGEYIMFLASYNDGWMDTTLYQSPEDRGNPFYSLYNDTIQYFLTWNSNAPHLRFEETNYTNFASYTPEPYIFYNHWYAQIQEYSDGERSSSNSSSYFKKGEGWSSAKYHMINNPLIDYSSKVIAHPYQLPGAPQVNFKSLQVGNSNAINISDSDPDHHAVWTIGSSNYVIADTLWQGYNPMFINKWFDISNLPGSGGSNLKITLVNDLGASSDYQRNSYWSVYYPRIPNFDGKDYFEFDISDNPSGNFVRIDVSNIVYNQPLLFVLGNEPKKVNFFPNGGNYTMIVRDDFLNADQHIVYHDSSNVIAITELTPVGTNGIFTDYSTADYESSLLMIYNKNLASSSQAYFDYRAQEYNAILAEVGELYQQFGGGINKHINGIRRFAHFAYNNSTAKPVGLFLMGKAIREVNYSEDLADGSGYRKNAVYYNQCLIPSFGEPSSDQSITSQLESANWEPLIPTGRVSVKNNFELNDYLSKVIEFENSQDSTDVYNSSTKDWQKQVVHFGGGINNWQQVTIGSYLSDFESIIEGSRFAGNVTTLKKSTTDPISPSELDDIMQRIDDGVSLITYFGHSLTTSSGFEINIDDVSTWENYDKYPVMLVNSCYNGNIYQTTLSSSEKFVLEPNKGAIAYIGSVRQGFLNELRYYSRKWYQSASTANYGGTLGEHMKYVLIENYNPGNLADESVMTQMTLNGDPMLKLYPHVDAEIELTIEGVSFSPTYLTAETDSIQLDVYIKNLGKSIDDTVYVEITRDFPGASEDSIYLIYLPFLNYDANVSLKIPLQPGIGAGINQFTIRVDIPSVHDEVYDESFNNQITKALYIAIDGIAPVEPYEFAVVPDSLVTVYASTFDPIADQETYRFEIDTIDFEGAPSGFHRYQLVTGFGGIQKVAYNEWNLSSSGDTSSLICSDSTVYFWRVKVDGDTTWRESSFQYIPGKQGWGQDHFFQFKNNSFFGLDYNRPAQSIDLQPYQRSLFCDVYSTTSNPGYLNNAWYLDAVQRSYGICTTNKKFHVVVIDPVTLEPWKTRNVSLGVNLNNNFGNQNDNGSCHQVMDFFTFVQNNATQLDSFVNMINNKVPDGHYLLIYSPMSTLWSSMESLDSAGVFGLFSSLGSTQAISGQVEGPMAFFCKKGDPSSVIESFASFPSQNVQLNALLEATGFGREKGPLIGPSTEWHNVYWKQHPFEGGPNADSVLLSIHAYDVNQNFQYSVDTAFSLNDSILLLNNLINASTYPYISLEASMMDTLNATAAQIDRWHVLFDPLPEAAIDGSSGHYWTGNDSIQRGELINFAVDVRNVFNIDMDSLLIDYWLTDENQYSYKILYPRQDSLRVGDSIRDTITIDTKDLSGWSAFHMEVNPYINGSTIVTDQPEQLHFNNVLQIPFFVIGDDENPLLDVTFDGIHILNGDIVDPNSEILITLKDDNEFLIMNEIGDTANFGIYLTDPNGIQKKINFMEGPNIVMDWVPADAQNKRFKILWPASFTQNGTYSLLVQGEDKSGNLSGDIEYRVEFEVVLESSITKMMNYPNPFSTSTRFVFTLTGSEVPDDILIQIMTVSGRVVREISEVELGPIHIGRNITEFAWDGTDQFGDPLANGVYLYRVKVKLNGEDLEQLSSGADQYFTKEFGKMYLMR